MQAKEARAHRTASMRVSPGPRWVARVLLAMFGIALGLIVLLPAEDHGVLKLTERVARRISEWGLPYSFTYNLVEFSANVALFVPLGILLPLAIGSLRAGAFWLTPPIALAISTGIELAQRDIPGRVSDPRDLVSNTLGAVLGVLILWFIHRLLLEPSVYQGSVSGPPEL